MACIGEQDGTRVKVPSVGRGTKRTVGQRTRRRAGTLPLSVGSTRSRAAAAVCRLHSLNVEPSRSPLRSAARPFRLCELPRQPHVGHGPAATLCACEWPRPASARPVRPVCRRRVTVEAQAPREHHLKRYRMINHCALMIADIEFGQAGWRNPKDIHALIARLQEFQIASWASAKGSHRNEDGSAHSPAELQSGTTEGALERV